MPVNFVDVIIWAQIGPYRVMPPDFLRLTLARPVWSIGRAIDDVQIEHEGAPYSVPQGTVLASLTADMYERPGFECIWLR